MAHAGGKKNNKKNQPSNVRYNAENRLMQNKVRRMVRCMGLTTEQATTRWLATRKRG